MSFWEMLQACDHNHVRVPGAEQLVCLGCIEVCLANLLKTPDQTNGPKPDSGNLGAYEQGWKNAFDFAREKARRKPTP